MAEVLHHDKLKDRSAIAAIDRHNRRLSSGKQEGNQFAKPFSRANVDPTLTRYNRQLVPFPHTNLLEAMDAAIAERVTGIVRRTSVRVISYIVSADEDFFTPAEGAELDASGRWDKKKLESWTERSMEFLKTTYGAENLLSATLHLDEKTPHIHVAIIPITPDGRLSAFDWLGSPKKCRDIQTAYDQAVGHLGLKRGLKGSVAQHQTTRRFYAELEKKLENIPEPPPPLPPEKGFPGSEKRKKYNEISEQREQFAQQMLKLVDETGSTVFTKAAEYDALKVQLEESQKKAAFYKEKYEAVKNELDTKTLRALDIATVAKLCGYTYYKEDGHFFGNLQKIKIEENRFEFTDYNNQRKNGKNAIDFMKIHLEITENRHVTPAEAIVRLAGVAGDARQVEDTIRQIALDEAEAQLAPLRPQFAGAVEAERQRQEERKRKEKREAAEAAARLAELEAAEARARQQMEQQPGQQQPEPEPEPKPTPPPPQLETPPPPAPEPEPEPEEPEPGMSMM